MAFYMLDTDICIYVMKSRSVTLSKRFQAAAGDLCVSSIAVAELQFGVEKSRKRAESQTALDAFLAELDVLAFDATAAHHYARIRAELERVGKPAGPHDMLIGGHARSLNLTVVTNNTREFDRIPGVRVENWA